MNTPSLSLPQAAPAEKPRFSKKVLNFFGFLMSTPSEEELIADGIVPTGRRYDRDLVEAMQRDAMREARP